VIGEQEGFVVGIDVEGEVVGSFDGNDVKGEQEGSVVGVDVEGEVVGLDEG
jgi:hypothetical protein